MTMYGVGVDLGATYVRTALADPEGVIIDKLVERTPKQGDNMAIPRLIASMIKKLLDKTGVKTDELRGIGIGSIGPLNIETGVLINPPNIPFKNVPLTEPLHREFHVPVFLLNDCTAAVVGEKHFGAGKDVENLVYVTISTGIGGGAYVDGHLLLGKEGNAVEIGHTVVDAEGKLICGCGKPGHWEAYSSGTGIPKLARLVFEENREKYAESMLIKRFGSSLRGLTSKDVYNAAKEGDEFASRVVERANFYNSIGMANIIQAYDPEIITIGGSVALNNVELVINPLHSLVERFAINSIPKIIPTPLGGDVVLYGAVALSLGLEPIKYI